MGDESLENFCLELLLATSQESNNNIKSNKA